MTRLIRTEIAKLTTVRGTWVLMFAAAALSAAAATGFIVAGQDLDTERGMRMVLHSSGTGSVLALVLGVIVAAGEFRHGTITDTYLTTPRRSRVTAAKVLAGLPFGVAIGLLSVGCSMLVATPWLAANGHPIPWGEEYVWRTLAGSVLWAAGYTVIGVTVGALVRNLAAGIVVAVGWFLVAEPIVAHIVTDVAKWLPASAAAAAGYEPMDGLLPQFAGVALLAGYTVAFAILAMVTTTRRDVT